MTLSAPEGCAKAELEHNIAKNPARTAQSDVFMSPMLATAPWNYKQVLSHCKPIRWPDYLRQRCKPSERMLPRCFIEVPYDN